LPQLVQGLPIGGLDLKRLLEYLDGFDRGALLAQQAA
jgi:hypothetical protein